MLLPFVSLYKKQGKIASPPRKFSAKFRERLSTFCKCGIIEKMTTITEPVSRTGELNRRASEKVSAHGQSEALARILPMLTEEEGDVFRRGRNAKKPTKSKNASVGEYVRSTGFEALIGYLYLTGQTKRMQQLFFGEGQ